MYDNRADTEVFGASYDFVELYLNYLELSDTEQQAMLATFDEEEQAQFDAISANLEKLHGYNAHKYVGNQPGSPAYHLDVLRSGVPGGWADTIPVKTFPDPPEHIKEQMPGYFNMAADVRALVQDRVLEAKLQPTPASHHTIALPQACDYRDETAIVVENLLRPDEIAAIKQDALEQPTGIWIPVGEDGMRNGFSLMGGGKIGSWRATTFSQELGELVWQRLKPIIPPLEYIPNGLSVDAKDAQLWRAVGVNTKLSFIGYRDGDNGNLVTHYDAPYSYSDGRKTLKSCILYFTDAAEGKGGATRFIIDPQASKPPTERDLSDWGGNATPDQVATSVSPQSGSALIFNHRVLHDSEPLAEGSDSKLIIRTDIVYEPVLAP